jgi:hypothetical protein
MAAFDEIDSAPGQNKFSVFYAIFNATMAFFKDVAAGSYLISNGAGAPVWSTITTYDSDDVTFSTGWNSSSTSSDNIFGATKNGNEVEFNMVVGTSTGGTTTAFTLPTGLRPLKEKYFLAAGFYDGSPIPLTRIIIFPSGVVQILVAFCNTKV